MFYIKMAGITIQIDNQYDYVEFLCRNYIIASPNSVDISIKISNREIEEQQKSLIDQSFDNGYIEGLCIYRRICDRLPTDFQAFLLHCAVIEYKGEGYAFAAKSGTGKSTHITLWRKRFGKDVNIVNGDKPIMRFVEGKLHAYGTPWCGKEGLNANTSVPLKALCFIERSETNSIRKIDAEEAISKIFHQLLSPKDIQTLDAMIPLLDKTLREIPCYVLGCNISEEAAEVAYFGMNENK